MPAAQTRVIKVAMDSLCILSSCVGPITDDDSDTASGDGVMDAKVDMSSGGSIALVTRGWLGAKDASDVVSGADAVLVVMGAGVGVVITVTTGLSVVPGKKM